MVAELSRNERIKEASDYLRGTLADGLTEELTGAIVDDDAQLVKFHGMYLQDDRDLRAERGRKKMEKAFAFMIRVRLPGGVCTPAQMRTIVNIARTYGNGSVRLTSRQTFQLHGVIKSNLKSTMRLIDEALLTTIAACGDVNRNVVCNPTAYLSPAHAASLALARAISDHLLPRTPAYREIWLDGERILGGENEAMEPIYGKTYLPRKFKIGIAVPPSNDADIYSHDLGFIAILDASGQVAGYNVLVGGGMGMAHGEPQTYPRSADVMGFCRPDQAVAVAEAVVTVQRDWGDRTDRKHARLKYTIDDRGLDAFRAEVERRAGATLEEPRPFAFTSTGDRFGWVDGPNAKSHLTLYVENGRLRDVRNGPRWIHALQRVAEVHDGDFRLTPNQNLTIANVSRRKRKLIEAVVAEHDLTTGASALRRNALACVALPTCGLALAESERSLPAVVTALEERLAAHGLAEEDIVIRMSGCPNGCSRPYLSEIGLVGKSPGRYNLYLGAPFDSSRLSKLYAEDLDQDGIVEALDPLFGAFRAGRQPGEHFGDYVVRAGLVASTHNGLDFHQSTGPRPQAVPLSRDTP